MHPPAVVSIYLEYGPVTKTPEGKGELRERSDSPSARRGSRKVRRDCDLYGARPQELRAERLRTWERKETGVERNGRNAGGSNARMHGSMLTPRKQPHGEAASARGHRGTRRRLSRAPCRPSAWRTCVSAPARPRSVGALANCRSSASTGHTARHCIVMRLPDYASQIPQRTLIALATPEAAERSLPVLSPTARTSGCAKLFPRSSSRPGESDRPGPRWTPGSP